VAIACGSKVLPILMFFTFALCERKVKNDKKLKYRSAEGYDSVQYGIRDNFR
jgi:hypothetical protein